MRRPGDRAGPAGTPAGDSHPGADASARAALGAMFVAAGGLALAIQTVLLRELIVSLNGDETAIALGLGAWLAGITAGALLARRTVRRRPEAWATAAFAFLAFAGTAGVLRARVGRWLLAPPPGELLPFGAAVLLAAAVLAIPGFLVGFLFTALAATAPRAGWDPGRGLARLYVLESLGSLAAGILVTFVIVPRIGGLRGLALAAALMLALGVVAARARIVPGRLLLPALALALAAFAVSPWGMRAEEATARLRFEGLVPGVPLLAWDDTPAQHLMIAGDPVHHLYAGGQYAGSFPDPAEHESMAHLLMSLAPRPRTLLLVGGGPEGTLRFLLRHRVERIDIVLADPEALAFLRRFLPPEDRRALDDPRVRLLADDPRRFLSRPPGGARGPAPAYDLMIVLEPPPVTLLLARLSTVEFYRLAAARLAPDGAIVVGIETAPNVLTGATAALAGSVAGALGAVFPVLRASPGPASLLVAGTDPAAVTLDPAILAGRDRAGGVASELFAPEVFSTLFPPGRVTGMEEDLARAAARVPPSRDARPVSFLHALALRRSLASGSAAAPARVSPRAIVVAALLPSLLALAAIALRRRRRGAVTLAAAHAIVITGACGMTWSLLVLFSYQARAGALYGRIGLLTAVFMLGLALGGLALTRAADAGPVPARGALAGTAAAALGFALLLPALLGGSIPGVGAGAGPGADLLHGLLLLGGGLVTGAMFPAAAGVLLAARRHPGATAPEASTATAVDGARLTAADLEAADHVGAAIAALAAGVALVPVLGLAGTAWLLTALQAAALAGILLAGSPDGRP